MRPAAAAFLLGLTLLVSGCGGVNSPSDNQTTVFTGVLDVGSSRPHTFTTSRSGEYSVTLTNLTPATGQRISLTVGQISKDLCVPISQAYVLRGETAIAGRIDKGSYCLDISDPGTLSQSETYTVTVSHP